MLSVLFWAKWRATTVGMCLTKVEVVLLPFFFYLGYVNFFSFCKNCQAIGAIPSLLPSPRTVLRCMMQQLTSWPLSRLSNLARWCKRKAQQGLQKIHFQHPVLQKGADSCCNKLHALSLKALVKGKVLSTTRATKIAGSSIFALPVAWSCRRKWSWWLEGTAWSKVAKAQSDCQGKYHWLPGIAFSKMNNTLCSSGSFQWLFVISKRTEYHKRSFHLSHKTHMSLVAGETQADLLMCRRKSAIDHWSSESCKGKMSWLFLIVTFFCRYM